MGENVNRYRSSPLSTMNVSPSMRRASPTAATGSSAEASQGSLTDTATGGIGETSGLTVSTIPPDPRCAAHSPATRR